MIIIHYYILNYMKLFQVMGSQSWMIIFETSNYDLVTTGDPPCHHDLWWRLRKLLYNILMTLWSYVTYVCFPTIKQYKTYSLNRFPIEKQHFTLAKWKKKTSAQKIHLDSRQLASLFPTSYKPRLIVEFPIVFPMNSHEIPWNPRSLVKRISVPSTFAQSPRAKIWPEAKGTPSPALDKAWLVL